MAEFSRHLRKPTRFGGGGGVGVVAEFFRVLRTRFGGGGSSRDFQ